MALSRRTGQRFQASIWPGFVDAMTGLLLVLMFVLTIFMVVQFVLRETITGQETELDQLAGEVAALAQALGLEERRASQLDARLTALNATLNDAQTQVETQADQLAAQAARIAALTSQRDATATALTEAQTRISSFEAQVAALISERDGALDTVAGLETEQARLLSEQEALNLALAQARTEVDAQSAAARLAAARLGCAAHLGQSRAFGGTCSDHDGRGADRPHTGCGPWVCVGDRAGGLSDWLITGS